MLDTGMSYRACRDVLLIESDVVDLEKVDGPEEKASPIPTKRRKRTNFQSIILEAIGSTAKIISDEVLVYSAWF